MSTLFTGKEPHPTVPLLDEQHLAVMEAKKPGWTEGYYAVRREGMARMEADPLQYGFEPPSWERADKALREFREQYPVGVIICLILGGHRAGKTEWRSKRTVQNLFGNRDYKVWACQAT